MHDTAQASVIFCVISACLRGGAAAFGHEFRQPDHLVNAGFPVEQQDFAPRKGAIMAGASGYLLKQVRGSDIVGAVRTVAAGGVYLNPRLGAQLAATPAAICHTSLAFHRSNAAS